MERWTIEKIRKGFEKFHKEQARYPTAHELDNYSHLPSSRQIQRKYGGLPELRKTLKLSGPHDFTKGPYSSERTRKINSRGHKCEQEVHKYLENKFGREFVHREYFFTDDRRTRTDFFVFYKGGNFSVDVFYPKDQKNLAGCLNSKMRAHKAKIMIKYPVIFLMMNNDINEEEIEDIVLRKKNALQRNQRVMTLHQFTRWGRGFRPMSHKVSDKKV
ncbi:MAG: hypothetical protein U9M92_00875 [Patescibacteria group bacterium]|nr:hypothetical protein [Patescibacteria group bacterium]